MKRAYLLMFTALLGGCLHASPQGAKNEAAPASVAAAEKKPELTAALVQKSVVKGKTTAKELLAALGTPVLVQKNEKQLPKEILAKVTIPLPPIARTKEFWRYRSTPYKTNGNEEQRVFSAMIFMDDDGVAVDYLTDDQALAPQ
ncbi:MAG TPA: hypothetical protein DCZ75_15575 [Geobacter sp.]|nr:hypothetical protein [Geobacter sp.]